ncbi:MAG TPA: hypothetical protein VGR67_09915 [Candidatus Polarisedimenticolia bacterium]|jgi:hypothetical protein|nr:hypothetical protein [Candidatus Polarisedimenticolia bacterium]
MKDFRVALVCILLSLSFSRDGFPQSKITVHTNAEPTEFHSPMVMDVPLEGLKNLPMEEPLMISDFAKYHCDDVSIKLLEVSRRQIGPTDSQLITKAKVVARPTRDKNVRLVFDLMVGEKQVLSWNIDEIEVEEGEQATAKEKSPKIPWKDLDGLLRTNPAPYLRISMSVSD